jgi:hypothetical protein
VRASPRITPCVALLVALATSTTAAASDGGAPPIKVETVRLTRPVWLLGLDDPSFLLGFRGHETGARVYVFPLANTTRTDQKEAGKQKEDTLGRETRELALFVSERIFVETNCVPTTAVVAVPGGGPVVSGQEWDLATLARVSAPLDADVVVSGTLAAFWGDAREEVKLDLWDAKARTRFHTARATTLGAPATSEALALASQVVAQLVSTKRCKRITPPATWAAPSKDLVAPYVTGLNQLLAQLFAESGVIPVSSLWGEDAMQRWYAKLREHMLSSTPARLMQLRGVLLSKAYGGPTWKTVSGPLLADLGTLKDPTDEIYQLSPLVFARLGSSGACAARKAAMASLKNPALASWLAKIDCGRAAAPRP